MTANEELILPLYKCHKQVRAAKITGVYYGAEPEDNRIGVEVGGKEVLIAVGAAFTTKRHPAPGWYYVVYDDGYESFSPAKAFESGYTLIEPEEGI